MEDCLLNRYSKITSFDVETTGLNPYAGKKIFSYCIGRLYYDHNNELDCSVDVYRLDNKDESINSTNWEILQEYWLDTSIEKVIHNAKFELHFLKCNGIVVPRNSIIHDTMIQSQILRNLAPSHALDYLCWEFCGYTRELDNRVKKEAKAYGNNYQLVNKRLMDQYQTADGERPLILHLNWIKEIMSDECLKEVYQTEIEIVKATQLEESHGLYLHMKNLRKLIKWMEDELEIVQKESYKLLNEYVNLNSDAQLRRLLFRKFGLPILKLTDSVCPVPSVDKDVLLSLREKFKLSIFDLIFKQRSYVKGLATIRSYLKFAVRGKIHPNLRTIITTPRKSSSNPNLQNVSKEAGLKNPFPVPLRKCFRPKKDCVFIPVDYSGIEMRLIINATREPELLDMLKKNPDADMHHPTVECFMMKGLFNHKHDKVFKSGVQRAKVFKAEKYKDYKVFRGAIKNTGFAISYGCRPPKVAIILAQPLDEIINGDTNYRRRFQRIDGFTGSIIEEVYRNGYIKTAWGRKLYVPRDKPYIGANYSIQGTAAEILKRAQVRLTNFLRQRAYKDIKLVLDIHDEFLFQFPKILLKRRNEILPEIYHLMVDGFEDYIDVPLRCEFSICEYNWNDKKDLEVIY